MKIPLYKPEITKADISAVLSVLRSGWISHRGPAVGRFGQAFAKAVGAKYAVAVSSGTAALHCALVAVGVKPGDEVIVPGLTYVATANAVRHAGAVPVFADVNAVTWTTNFMQYDKTGALAVIGVSLYGYPIGSIHTKLPVIADMAEALGQAAHTTSAWSFFANKHITACGEGGMVTTNRQDVADKARAFSHQGVEPDHDEYAPPSLGWNYRMTSVQAAFGLSQLRRLGSVLMRKRAVARWYRSEMDKSLPVRFQADHPAHAHWLVSARVSERYHLREHLAAAGVETRPVFPAMGDTPVAHRIAAEGISFPSYPTLTRAQVRYVCEKVREFYR